MAELSPERAAIVAKAKETRERNKALRSELITEMSGTSDENQQLPQMTLEALIFIEGMKLAMTNLQVKAPNDVAKCVPLAKEFVKIVKENA